MFDRVPLGAVLTPVSRPVSIDPAKTYPLLGAHWYAKGLYVKDTKVGAEIRAERLYRVEQGDFVYNRLFAWKGSFAVASESDHGCFVSNEFPCFAVEKSRLDVRYLQLIFSRESAWNEALDLSTGGTPTSRNRLKEDKFLAMRIPLPSLPEQRRIVAEIEALSANIEEVNRLRRASSAAVEALGRAILFGNNPPDYPPTTTLATPLSSLQTPESAVGRPVSHHSDNDRLPPVPLIGGFDPSDGTEPAASGGPQACPRSARGSSRGDAKVVLVVQSPSP